MEWKLGGKECELFSPPLETCPLRSCSARFWAAAMLKLTSGPWLGGWQQRKGNPSTLETGGGSAAPLRLFPQRRAGGVSGWGSAGDASAGDASAAGCRNGVWRGTVLSAACPVRGPRLLGCSVRPRALLPVTGVLGLPLCHAGCPGWESPPWASGTSPGTAGAGPGCGHMGGPGWAVGSWGSVLPCHCRGCGS